MKKINIFNFLENWSEKNFYTANSIYEKDLFIFVRESVRILFSIVMILRYLNAWPVAPLFNYPDPNWPIAYLVAYLMLALGMFSPLVLIVIFYLESKSPLFIMVKINQLLPMVLFFLGTGRFFSIDNIISRYSPRYKKYLEHFSILENNFPKIRIYLFLPYALLSIIAVFGHLKDPIWLDLTVIDKLFRTPFSTHLSASAINWMTGFGYFSLITQLLTLVQLVWEICLLPAFFFRRFFIYSILYGYLFFFISKFVIHLSSLGTLEALYWFLLFHPETISLFKARYKQ